MARWQYYLLLLLTAALPVGVTAAREPDTVSLISACIEARFENNDEEVFRDTELELGKLCPRLARVLRAGDDPRLADITPPPADRMSLAQLQDLRQALESFRTGPDRTGRFDRGMLEEVIAASYEPVEEAPAKEPSLFERFDEWLRSLLGDTDPDTVRPIADWFEALGLSEETWDLILKISVVLLIAFALFVVFNELRAGGSIGLWRRLRYRATRLFARRRRQRGSRARASRETRATLPPRERAIALLRHALEALTRGGTITHSASRTNREIAHQLESRSSPCATGFRQLADIADRVLYSPWQPDETALQTMEAVVRRCEQETEA